MRFLERIAKIIPDYRKTEARAKEDPFFPAFHLFAHTDEQGVLLCHRVENDEFSVWARDDDGEPAVFSDDVLTRFHRYLSGIVLPAVEKQTAPLTHDPVFRADPWFAVFVINGVVRMEEMGYDGARLDPTEARALAACLLAAADEAEGGVQHG